jgi:hypothetical protein
MYLLRGMDEAGDPVDLPMVVCWRCGVPVMTSLVSMTEHVDRMHPLPTVPESRPAHAAPVLPAQREPVDSPSWTAPQLHR